MTADGAALLERLLPAHGARADSGGALSERWGQPPERRSQARAWLDDHGLPTSREEWWRYADLASITGGPWTATAGPPPWLPDRLTIDRLTGSYGGPRLVFVDGTFVAALSDLDAGTEGVFCSVQTSTAGGRLGGGRPGLDAPQFESRYDGFQALNDAAGHDGAHVLLDAGTRLEAPISVVHVSTGRDDHAVASHPRTTVELEAGTEATIIETYLGLGGPHLTNARTAIRVGRRARLTHFKLLQGHPDSAHVAHTRIGLVDDASVRSWSLLAGAAVVRNTVDAYLRAPGASIDLEGIYLPVGTQRYDTAVSVEHLASHGTSRQQYRGVIDDRARGSFSGRVLVEQDTVGNHADQVNRGLLLSPNAEADSRPWLEISADDVRCTHGAAIGRLDGDALFYLRSRGIPEPEARRMLVTAFVDELVSVVEVPVLRALAADLIARTAATKGARP